MRRVLLVGDYPPPYGGLSVQITSLRGQLAARRDTEVQVLDIGARRRERRNGCLPVRTPVDLVREVYGHARRGFTPHLHTNGHNRRSWIIAAGCAGAAMAGGHRAIISLGSGAMPAFVDAASSGIRALARMSLALARTVIVRNERARAALLALGVAPAKIVILPGFYGVAADEIGVLPADAVPFRQHHDPLIGAIATCGPEYGISLLIDAAARLRPRHPRLGVILVGPDRFEDVCPPWVLGLGEQDRPALLAVMQTLDVFVRPTYIDGDASSVREALALGVRVVASATDFRPDGVWRAPVGDADALADTIEAALAGRPVRAEWTSLPALLALYDGRPVDRLPTGGPERVHDDDAAVGRTPGSIHVG